jgi:hypothetical protein
MADFVRRCDDIDRLCFAGAGSGQARDSRIIRK